MEGLLWLLALGAVFYLMMRFGCGAHMVHGDHGEHQAGASGRAGDLTSDTDPVCGMKVPPDAGYGRTYGGRALRFCSRECLEKFDADPARYTSQKGVQQ